MTDAQIAHSFTYHPPTGEDIKNYQVVRDAGRLLADVINQRCPESREKSLAITKIEEAIMWANASIARKDKNVVS